MSEPSFEKDLEQLERIVEELESGNLPLDSALKRFEEGVRLTRRCEKALNEAEKRIEILMRNADGKLEAQPFGVDETQTPQEPAGQGNTEPHNGKRSESSQERSELFEDEEDVPF